MRKYMTGDSEVEGDFRKMKTAPQALTERTTTDFMRDELGAPKVVDRSTFHAELDALRVREKAHTSLSGAKDEKTVRTRQLGVFSLATGMHTGIH
jgi:hypothetical protein